MYNLTLLYLISISVYCTYMNITNALTNVFSNLYDYSLSCEGSEDEDAKSIIRDG